MGLEPSQRVSSAGVPGSGDLYDPRVPPLFFYEKGRPCYEFTNFYEEPVIIDGDMWPTTEHYFQAMKFLGNSMLVEQVRRLRSAREAFDFSRKYESQWTCKPERWGVEKDEFMLKALRAKFSQSQHLRQLLLDTGRQKIVEHTANDKYWADGGDGSGKNMLGTLLMQVRNEIRKKQHAIECVQRSSAPERERAQPDPASCVQPSGPYDPLKPSAGSGDRNRLQNVSAPTPAVADAAPTEAIPETRTDEPKTSTLERGASGTFKCEGERKAPGAHATPTDAVPHGQGDNGGLAEPAQSNRTPQMAGDNSQTDGQVPSSQARQQSIQATTATNAHDAPTLPAEMLEELTAEENRFRLLQYHLYNSLQRMAMQPSPIGPICGAILQQLYQTRLQELRAWGSRLNDARDMLSKTLGPEMLKMAGLFDDNDNPSEPTGMDVDGSLQSPADGAGKS